MPLDQIIYQIKQNEENYTYVNLWNVLVAKGAILDTKKTDYQNLNLNNFKEPQRTCVRLIKQNPRKNFTNNTNNKFMNNEEEPKDDE